MGFARKITRFASTFLLWSVGGWLRFCVSASSSDKYTSAASTWSDSSLAAHAQHSTILPQPRVTSPPPSPPLALLVSFSKGALTLDFDNNFSTRRRGGRLALPVLMRGGFTTRTLLEKWTNPLTHARRAMGRRAAGMRLGRGFGVRGKANPQLDVDTRTGTGNLALAHSLCRVRGGVRGVGEGRQRKVLSVGAVGGSSGNEGKLKRLSGTKGELGIRVKSAVLLIASFVSIVAGLRQTGSTLLVAFLQCAIFKEILTLVRDEVSEVLLEGDRPGAGNILRRQQWAVFGVMVGVVYGRLLVVEVAQAAAPGWWLSGFARWYAPGCAVLYTSLLMNFIGSLNRPQLIAYQLGQFSAAHFVSFLVLLSTLSSFAARAGLIWFLLPSALVIINDIMAYFCGRLFGRTPLTPLSPKKTREGFIGAALCTSAMGWLLGRWWSQVGWLSAPCNVFLSGGTAATAASVDALYAMRKIILPWGSEFWYTRTEIHGFCIGLIVSLIGPFGGFLASGVKRAYGVKDFGNTIPGHGGATDRFDCQVVILALVYFYLKGAHPSLSI